MKLTLSPTPRIEQIDGVTCRVWLGHDERDVPVRVHIPALQVLSAEPGDHIAFARALAALPEPDRQPVLFNFRFVV